MENIKKGNKMTPQELAKAKESLTNLLKTAPSTNFMMEAVRIALSCMEEYPKLKVENKILRYGTDERVEKIKELEVEIVELKKEISQCHNDFSDFSKKFDEMEKDKDKEIASLQKSISELPDKEWISYCIEGSIEIDDAMARDYEYEDRRKVYMEVATAIHEAQMKGIEK